jgi:hypothetical protein
MGASCNWLGANLSSAPEVVSRPAPKALKVHAVVHAHLCVCVCVPSSAGQPNEVCGRPSKGHHPVSLLQALMKVNRATHTKKDTREERDPETQGTHCLSESRVAPGPISTRQPSGWLQW